MISHMGVMWNLWHGCTKYSEGCRLCYVYRADEKYDRDASFVYRTKSFELPIKRNRAGEYKIPSGETVFMCFSSDFLLDKADEWRKDAWKIIKERSDLNFFFITKRILRFMECIPDDWGEGYANVSIAVTCETQKRADERIPYFLTLPIQTKSLVLEPLLEKIDLSAYLDKQITQVIAGGESGEGGTPCDFSWFLSLREQCEKKNIPFHFKQTGANFIKDGKLYRIPRKFQHSQANAADINFNDHFHI